MNIEAMYIDELIDKREQARKDKDYRLSDEIRDYLDTKSVIIFDTKDGQEVYHELKGTTRQDVIDKIQKDIKAEAMFNAWLFSNKT